MLVPPPIRINPDRFAKIHWVIPYNEGKSNYILQGIKVPTQDYYRFEHLDLIGNVPPEDLKVLIGNYVLRSSLASWEWTRLNPNGTWLEPYPRALRDRLPLPECAHLYVTPAEGCIFTAESTVYTGHFEAFYDHDANVSEEDENRLWDEVRAICRKYEKFVDETPLGSTPDFTKVGRIQMAFNQVGTSEFTCTYTPSMYKSDVPSFACFREIKGGMFTADFSTQAHLTHTMLRKMMWVQQDPNTFVFEVPHTKLTAIYGPSQPSSTYDGGIWF